MKDKIKQLLGLNLPNNVVATATGVPEAEITALLSEESFAKEVAELRIKNLSEAAQRDQSYNLIEDSLLEKMKDQLDNGMFGVANPGLILKAIAIVNAAKRRSAPAELASQVSRPIATLVIPISIAAKFIVDSKNQVVEVAGSSLATMSASGVQKALTKLREGETYENQAEHEKDTARAQERLVNLKKIEEHSVVALL